MSSVRAWRRRSSLTTMRGHGRSPGTAARCSVREPSRTRCGTTGRDLPRYAEAQLALAGHRNRFLATGVPDRSPAQLPLEYRRLLAELAAQPVEDGGLTAEEASALDHRLPVYDHRCAELAASPMVDTLQHDDLHSNNVCWPGEVDDTTCPQSGSSTGAMRPWDTPSGPCSPP
jgi:hypothetical protein